MVPARNIIVFVSRIKLTKKKSNVIGRLYYDLTLFIDIRLWPTTSWATLYIAILRVAFVLCS